MGLSLLGGCVTNYPRETMDPPWVPEETAESIETDFQRPDNSTLVPVYFSGEDKPSIDGDFSEWGGLDGPLTRLTLFGGSHNPQDAEAFFVLRTDGTHLYIYSRVTDDVTHENFLPGSMAWRGDTVEIFFGTDTSKHKKYTSGDNQIRLVPRSKADPMDVDITINQRTIGKEMVTGGKILGGAAVYSETGYEIEASIPLSLLMIDGLKVGQKIRCEFQVNDADSTERDRVVHWISDKDVPWFDPSVWGNGEVTDLPENRGGVPHVL